MVLRVYSTFKIDGRGCRHVRVGADRLPCIMQGSSLGKLVIGEILVVLEGVWKKDAQCDLSGDATKALLSNHDIWGTLMSNREDSFIFPHHVRPCPDISQANPAELFGSHPQQCDVKTCIHPRCVLGCLRRSL